MQHVLHGNNCFCRPTQPRDNVVFEYLAFSGKDFGGPWKLDDAITSRHSRRARIRPLLCTDELEVTKFGTSAALRTCLPPPTRGQPDQAAFAASVGNTAVATASTCESIPRSDSYTTEVEPAELARMHGAPCMVRHARAGSTGVLNMHEGISGTSH
eukprot:366391-Chlamydomonas_euryale.AAC.16